MTNDPEIKYFFVRRPIFAAVISIAIVLLGIFSLHSLPIDLYPRITPPVVQVTAVYPGATAQDVANAVAAPIEQQLSGIPGLLYYKSSNASDGSMNLQIYFDISRDQDLAAVDVQNQIQLAMPQLPQEVVRNGVTVKKAQTNILMALSLSSSDPRYDAGYLSNYSQIYVQDELKRLPGVGDATTFGQLDLSMLLSLDPDRLSQLGLTVTDVANAVSEQNTTNPAGRIGREPSPPGTQLTIPVTTLGRLTDPKQYENIIVRAQPDGSIVHIGDVGHVTMGQRDYDLVGRLDGHPTALILVYLRPGASALDVDKTVVARMQQLQHTFPQGITWSVPFDTTPFITQSVKEVVETLIEALLLVTGGRVHLLAELAGHAHSVSRRARVAVGRVLRDAAVGILGQPAHAVRARPRDRHRRRRRHRGDRERGPHHGRGAREPGGRRRPRHPAGRERARRHRARALRGVHPGRLRGRHHRPDVQTVRDHDRGIGHHFGDRRAHTHAGLVRDSAQARVERAPARVLRVVQPPVRSPNGPLRARRGARARPPAAVDRRVRRDPGAHLPHDPHRADGVPADRGQGLLRHLRRAPRRRIAPADERRRAKRREVSARSTRREARRGARRLEPDSRREPNQLGHHVCEPQAVGRARERGRHPQSGECPLLLESGRQHLRIQLAGDSGHRRHVRSRAQPARPGRQRPAPIRRHRQ